MSIDQGPISTPFFGESRSCVIDSATLDELIDRKSATMPGASSRPAYFEDCRKRPKRQRGKGFFHEPTPNVFCETIGDERLFRGTETPESLSGGGGVCHRPQDSLGLGWANHDHHTFRSSRECFVDLIKAWELLGFHRRERYYAGQEAGWGAQIVEQPIEGIIIFNDVDLNPDEVEVDFSRKALASQPKLGTIGLWCGLHGESFLEAGMHHLECRFDHALLREQLAAASLPDSSRRGARVVNPSGEGSLPSRAF